MLLLLIFQRLQPVSLQQNKIILLKKIIWLQVNTTSDNSGWPPFVIIRTAVPGSLLRKSGILNSNLCTHQLLWLHGNCRHENRSLCFQRCACCRLLQYDEHGANLSPHLDVHLWPCRPHPRSAEELNTPHHWTWKTNACSSRCSYRSEVRHSRRHEGWWLMTTFWSYIAVVFFEERITWKTAISNTDFSCEFIPDLPPPHPNPRSHEPFLAYENEEL